MVASLLHVSVHGNIIYLGFISIYVRPKSYVERITFQQCMQ